MTDQIVQHTPCSSERFSCLCFEEQRVIYLFKKEIGLNVRTRFFEMSELFVLRLVY